ncbi:MAG TPA: FAD:protein FMN transferase, partial [Thermoanaerobaculia bacterium]|nr:FAD:protein FMN transferase [Thermoanaerobaculia bacterium]
MKRLAPILLLPLFLAPASAAGAEPASVERRVLAMGTEATLVVEADDRAAALAASEQALAALAAVEARLSTWSDDSELAKLNAAPVGVPVALSPQLAADLALAAECRRATDGAFEPAVGALAAAWGLRDGGRLPGDGEITEALAAAGPEAVELGVVEKAGATAVRRHAAARLEEGGFGKGVGLAAAAEALTGAGVRSAAVDLGGQLMLLGGATGRVAVADPRHRGRALAVLDLDAGSVATSGNGERGLVVDGRRLGHLLDPRSGRPAADFGSLTVWAAD